jgi:hypothetical protein
MEVNQVEDKSEIAYRCFVDTCRSPATRDNYIRALSFFMSYLKLPPGAYDRLLDKDTKLIQMDIYDLRFYHPSKKTWKLFGHSRHLHCGLEQVLRNK